MELPGYFDECAKALAGEPVLVTGGSGYVGQHVCLRLRRAGLAVTLTCHPKRMPCLDGPLEGCVALPMDLGDPASIRNAVLAISPPPRAVVHCAGVRGGRYELEPNLSHSINVLGTENILDALDRAWGNAGGYCFLFISTDIVYAGTKGQLLEENSSKLNPLSVYATHKLHIENMIRARVPNFCILRGPYIYGLPADYPRNTVKDQAFFLNLLEKLESGVAASLFVDERRTPCHMDDCVEIIFRALLKFTAKPRALGSRVFNLTSGDSVTRYEFGSALCEIFGYDKALLQPIELIDTNMDVAGVKRKVIEQVLLSNAIVKSELLVEGHSIYEGLRKVASTHIPRPKMNETD